MKTARSLRRIPAVETLLQALGPSPLPRPWVVATVRRELAALRRADAGPVPDVPALVARIRACLDRATRSRLQPVLNATGVLLHTNLGRAPLASAAVEAVAAAAAHYCNLELDLELGDRSSRGAYVEQLLALACHAEAATVVNNCAAALVLILRHFHRPDRTEVVVSRGELVQIGGGFRIPEILEASGCRLREVGTTNRTTAADYARALRPETALVLRVHRSNFFMGGFVETPAVEELAVLTRRQRIPLVEDLGSGALGDTRVFGLPEREPTPALALEHGVDLVCFSGDKLLGGPQAGIIAGKARAVAALKKDPFFRALRCDKLILAALQATCELHLHPDSSTQAGIPVLAQAALSLDQLQARAEEVVRGLAGLPARVRLRPCQSQFGGGTLPQSALPSVAVELSPDRGSAAELASRLRCGRPPVVACVARDRLRLDVRTLLPGQVGPLIAALRQALGAPPAEPPDPANASVQPGR